MEGYNLMTIIGLISTFISLLLAIFIFSVESKNKISNRLFAYFLILNAIEFSGWFSNLLFDEPSNLLVFKNQLSHLTLPIFFLYILSICYSDFKLKWKHLWHAVPFIIANIVMTPRLYLGTIKDKITLFQSFNELYETVYIHFSLHIQSIIYITLGFIVLKRAKKIFIENYSSGAIKIYKWLFQLLLFMSALYGVAIVKNILKYFGQKDSFQASQIALSLVILCFASWYVLKALRHPSLFSGVDSKIPLANDIVQEEKITPEQVGFLTSFMETEKPYLNPSLSIKNLAKEIQMNSRELSVLINQHLNQHFFDFVNEYRIKEAMNILKDPNKKELTVLEILYEIGFNSKSSFNTAFKKHTGLTPTAYRKSQQ